MSNSPEDFFDEAKAREMIKSYPEDVVNILDSSLTAKGIVQFMRAHNRLLGESPMEVLKQEGGQEKVLNAVHAFDEGYYI